MSARSLTTLLHELLLNHYIVRDVYQYPNDELLTRHDGLLVQTKDGAEFRITVVETHGGK